MRSAAPFMVSEELISMGVGCFTVRPWGRCGSSAVIWPR